MFVNPNLIKVYLVTGGMNGHFDYLSTTETLVRGDGNGADTWFEISDLPRPMMGMRSVSIDNMIVLTGTFEVTRNCISIE